MSPAGADESPRVLEELTSGLESWGCLQGLPARAGLALGPQVAPETALPAPRKHCPAGRERAGAKGLEGRVASQGLCPWDGCRWH